jgi:methylmalonyl-CoA/ethylmalonyl-CoA epimerase
MSANGLSRIRQIAMTVHDVKRAVGFYRDTLGLRLLFEAPPNFAFFDCDGIRLMLAPPEGEFAPPGSVLYFHVDDILASHGQFAAAGVSFKTAPHVVAKLPDREVWLADFGDGEGNTLALMAEVPLAQAAPA